jgi:hypothetical protein
MALENFFPCSKERIVQVAEEAGGSSSGDDQKQVGSACDSSRLRDGDGFDHLEEPSSPQLNMPVVYVYIIPCIYTYIIT